MRISSRVTLKGNDIVVSRFISCGGSLSIPHASSNYSVTNNNKRPFSSVYGAPHNTTATAHYHHQRRHQSTDSEDLGAQEREKSIETLMFSRPLPERAAAIFVAQYLLRKEKQATAEAKSATGETSVVVEQPSLCSTTSNNQKSVLGVPLTTFVSGMPSLTRDAIFREHLDVTRWIRQTRLLELVYLEEDERVLTEAQHTAAWKPGHPLPAARDATDLIVDDSSTPTGTVDETSSSTSPAAAAPKEPFRRYGALEFVRLTVSPHDLLRICEVEDEDDGERKVPSASPSSSAASSTITTTNTSSRGAAFVELEAFATLLGTQEGQRSTRWFFFNEAVLIAKREASKYSGKHPLRYFLKATPSEIKSKILSPEAKTFLWVREEDLMMACRRPNETLAPVVKLPEQPRARKAVAINNFGGWGSQMAVPTKEDVYEILRYVPINWGNFGNLNIPAKIKKKHIRSSSVLMWFRRQPHYFELRNMSGTIEVRRSPILHPEHHNMTLEEAKAMVEHGISTGTINSLVMVGPDGRPIQQVSPAEKHLQKFFYRVCPPYFVPFSLIMQRCTKKNVKLRELQDIAAEHPEDFEIVSAVGLPVPFVRKRAGADSARWKKAFIDDLTSRPKDIPAIGAICNHVCATWDRAEYVYVLLSPEEQCLVGSYEEMVQIIRRHPELFKVGEKFFCRVDSSDPLFSQQPEPMESEMTSRTYQRDENPYLSSKELAKVFHFIASTEEPCTPAFFVRGSSPAMRVALPPRIVTILQEFPRLFACKETAPGVFSIRKLQTTAAYPNGAKKGPWSSSSSRAELAQAGASRGGSVAGTPADGDGIREEDGEPEEDSSWCLEEEEADAATMSKKDVVEAVRQLIPEEGVEYDKLLLWASLQVQRAVNHQYGGLLKMLETEKNHFALTRSESSTLVQKR